MSYYYLSFVCKYNEFLVICFQLQNTRQAPFALLVTVSFQIFCVVKPKSITPTFTETSPQGKLWTQIMKVADTNGDKS